MMFGMGLQQGVTQLLQASLLGLVDEVEALRQIQARPEVREVLERLVRENEALLRVPSDPEPSEDLGNHRAGCDGLLVWGIRNSRSSTSILYTITSERRTHELPRELRSQHLRYF